MARKYTEDISSKIMDLTTRIELYTYSDNLYGRRIYVNVKGYQKVLYDSIYHTYIYYEEIDLFKDFLLDCWFYEMPEHGSCRNKDKEHGFNCYITTNGSERTLNFFNDKIEICNRETLNSLLHTLEECKQRIDTISALIFNDCQVAKNEKAKMQPGGISREDDPDMF